MSIHHVINILCVLVVICLFALAACDVVTLGGIQ